MKPRAATEPIATTIYRSDWLQTAVRRRYPLNPRDCWFVAPGRNDTYCLDVGRRRYYLRVYRHGRRSRAQVLAELQFLHLLKKGGVPVTVPVPDRRGQYVWSLSAPEGRRWVVLFEEAPGHLPCDGDDWVSAMGQVAARMHRVADATPYRLNRPQLDLNYLVDQPLQAALRRVGPRPELTYLRRTAKLLKQRVQALLPQRAPEYGLCHGDLFTSNVLVNKHGITLIDFDDCGYGWRTYDLSVLRGTIGLQQMKGDPRHREMWECRWRLFAESYGQERPLTEAELEAVKLFAPIHEIYCLGYLVESAPVSGLEHHLVERCQVCADRVGGFVELWNLL